MTGPRTTTRTLRSHWRLMALPALGLAACQDFSLVAQEKPSPDGGEPELAVNPSQVVFSGITPADGTQTDEVTLENVGDSLLTLGSLTIEGVGDWTLLEGPELTQLEPGEQTTVTVAWTPVTPESEAQLLIPSDDQNSPALVDLLGTAELPELVVWDTPFGEGYVDCPVYDSVTIENIGEVDATIVAVSAADDGWTADTVSLPLVLPPGDTIVVGVTWSPEALGAEETGTLTVEEQTTGAAQGELTGTVIAHPLRFSPEPVAFDPLYLSCEDRLEVRLHNDSSCDVELTDLEVDSAAFTVDSSGLPTTIPNESSVPVYVDFQPTERIAYSATLEATVDGQSVEVDLTGEGILDSATDSFEVVEPADEPIYAHSATTLYTYDAATGTLSTIGSTGVLLFDIAIDSYGQLWGLDSSGTIYQVDSTTGVATSYMSTSAYGNGLAVLQDGTLIVTSGYDISEIDWSTGATTTLASSLWGVSSGDIVEWDGYLYWTVTGSGSDDLLEYELATGTLSRLGSTGASSLWGIVAPDGDLYAFSSSGRVYELDSSTGAYMSSTSTSASFYGAAHNPAYGSHPGWSFQLTDEPRSYDDIMVEVNGTTTTDFDWDPSTNQVTMDDTGLLSGGDTVVVTYYLVSECE